MKNSNNPQFQYLPAVQQIIEAYPDCRLRPALLTELIRRELDALREKMARGKVSINSKEAVLTLIKTRLDAQIKTLLETPLKRVVNATGVVLHTGLGRAPLGEHALQYLSNMMPGYLNLEFDIEIGERGERLDLTDDYLCLLTGAELSAVVNNNAAAVMLALNSLANRKEVIVSRGELIEIGGSFRLPDVMKKSGAKMVEVGTTNRTHLHDYEEAISKRTGAILLAHTSNYRVQGFTKKPSETAIIELAHRQGIPVIMDLGSGALMATETMGLPHEPLVAEAVDRGFDVVTFSADKLLGAGQAGLLVGKQAYIEKVRKNPLMRVLRCDKITLSLLAFSLSRYAIDSDLPDLCSYHFLTSPPAQLRRHAEHILSNLDARSRQVLNIDICDTHTEAGSGSMPTETIPSVALRIAATAISDQRLAQLFRQQDPPVIGYLKERHVYLDLKAVSEKELPFVISALKNVAKSIQERRK